MASSLLSSTQKCDVFVSFEKSDTGKTFVSHLYRSLNRKGIATFKEELKLPNDQPFEMLGDIGDPKIALVVVSENYISSLWCMNQLTEILKFMKEGSLNVIPIFYEIDPSDLQSVTQTMPLIWSRALTLLASLPGEFTDYWNDDAGLIDKVTDDICEKLTTSTLSDYSDLFGMDRHMKALYEMLDLGSNNQDVQKVVGISGVRGVGKTTLARYAYEEISHNFHAHVFIENVYKIYQERSPSRLQEEFLSKLVLQSEALATKNSKDGYDVVKSRLRHRKVLFIADGVDNMEQVEDLWKVASWLGPGSRVILTTQDCSMFVAKGLGNVYEVRRLRYDEALQFFYQFAFKGQPPYNRFKQLSVRATKLAGCLPLSLKILGSCLNGKGEKDWESALQRLEAEPDKVGQGGVPDLLKTLSETRSWSSTNVFDEDEVLSVVEDNTAVISEGLLNMSEKRTKSLPSSISSVLGALITENTMKSFSSPLEPVLRKVVRQEVEYGISKRFRFSRSSSFPIEAPENTTLTLKLMFRKNLMKPIFTGSKISDVDNNPLEIILVDDSNNPVNLDRPIKLDIVPLHGDFPSGDKWSSDEFEINIVKERDGKRPLLAGDVSVTVRNGVATIGEIEFTDNSSWIRSRKFRIGAKVAKGGSDQGVAVCEAMTEAIVVRDHRGELYKKHHPPMLEDEVWRLEKIGKDGAFHKKLSSNHIKTVQDFLKLSVVDLDKLREIMGPGMSDRMWEVTLKHARECILGNKLYISKGPNFVMILNPICEVMKAIIDDHVFSSQEALNQLYVKKLVREAYLNWNLLEVGERTTNEAALLTQGDDKDQQYAAGHYHNIEINRSYQQNGYVQESVTNNLEIVNEGYITTLGDALDQQYVSQKGNPSKCQKEEGMCQL